MPQFSNCVGGSYIAVEHIAAWCEITAVNAAAYSAFYVRGERVADDKRAPWVKALDILKNTLKIAYVGLFKADLIGNVQLFVKSVNVGCAHPAALDKADTVGVSQFVLNWNPID